MVMKELEYLSHVIGESAPPQGWHCPNVQNIKQVSENERYYEQMLENLKEDKDIYFLAHLINEMIRLINRYERELDYVDMNINKWIEYEVIKITTGYQRDTNYAGIQFFRCPQCHQRVISSEIVEQIGKLHENHKIKKKDSFPIYPKIRM